MKPPTLLDLLVGLSDTEQRARAAKALARHLGVTEVLLFTRDPTLDVLIPARGMPQTLNGGRSWRDFLAACPKDGEARAEVEMPIGTQHQALALNYAGCSLICLGGEPPRDLLDEVTHCLPLLSALQSCEQQVALARSEAVAAQEAASRAQQLAVALDAARAEAASLNAEFREEHRRKDEFLAMLGHELRNPLAPLVTAIDLIYVNRGSWQVPPQLVDAMRRQTTQLARLVDDLLDVSRVSRGRIELRREPLSLTDVLRHAVEENQALFKKKRQHLTVTGLDQEVRVHADRARLMQVFGNLFNNTAKYTDAGGHIEVCLQQQDEHAVVHIRDDGIGIAPDMLPHVFDLFCQAAPTLGRAEGGLGIGLTLVRSLIELHGGSVTATSAGLGQGSTFSITLPCLQAAEHDRPAAPPAHNQPRSATSTGHDALRILIVDDNRDAADSMAILLDTLGHETAVAYDGDSALELPFKSQADLILLDIGLPGIDGFEVARRLRADTKPGARLVAVTGYGTDEGKRRTREAGFDAHIVKPITAEILRELLQQRSA